MPAAYYNFVETLSHILNFLGSYNSFATLSLLIKTISDYIKHLVLIDLLSPHIHHSKSLKNMFSFNLFPILKNNFSDLKQSEKILVNKFSSSRRKINLYPSNKGHNST